MAAAALLCSQTALAFDASTINFEQQAYSYSNSYGFDSLAINDAQDQPVDSAMRFNESPAHRLPKYLSTAPEKDWDYLMGQTYTILGLSVATVGLMTFLPESVTNWTPEDRDFSNLAGKWWDNVSAGPVWDKDDHYLNYVMHPYFGGVYYTAARHSGFTEFESFLYSFTMSTFFWEYGVESFAEVPSIQDIIVTPLFGAAVGEWMYLTEKEIVADGGEVMGSDTLGGVSLFFLNPVGHIHYWVTDWWQGDTDVRMNYDPWFNNHDAARFAADAGAPYDSQFIGMQVSLKF
ncbi:DUF3943 domain-containing protein [Enterovibrio makurazakiensis]|uniref:DUF3943 domain-containing protein n=1 Tax=Enterovibrio makurazakiensis TaxID=2910232 RepID=UPI003D2150C6